MTQDLPQASNSASSFKVPGPAGMHYPQIGIWRADHTKRHPEMSPLSPTVAPAVLHERQFVRDAHRLYFRNLQVGSASPLQSNCRTVRALSYGSSRRYSAPPTRDRSRIIDDVSVRNKTGISVSRSADRRTIRRRARVQTPTRVRRLPAGRKAKEYNHQKVLHRSSLHKKSHPPQRQNDAFAQRKGPRRPVRSAPEVTPGFAIMSVCSSPANCAGASWKGNYAD